MNLCFIVSVGSRGDKKCEKKNRTRRKACSLLKTLNEISPFTTRSQYHKYGIMEKAPERKEGIKQSNAQLICIVAIF